MKGICTEQARTNMRIAVKKRWASGEDLLKKAHAAYKEKHPARYVNCKICSALIRVVRKNYQPKYCSQRCYGISKKGKSWQENMSTFLPKGSKHYNWSGGFKKSRLPTQEDIEWRNKVFLRDDYTCQECRKRGCYLEAHHIKRKHDFPELKHVVNNGITLCYKCHKLTYSKEEEFQTKYEQLNKQKSIKILNFNNNYALPKSTFMQAQKS